MRTTIKYLLLIGLLAIQVLAQTYILKSSGELLDLKSEQNQIKKIVNRNLIYGLDTLSYQPNGSFDVQMSITSQDVLVQWFIAPADLIIKSLGFRCSQSGSPVHFKLIKLNWDHEQAEEISYPKYVGYYPNEGDGFNNAGAFPDEVTGDWVDKSGPTVAGDLPVQHQPGLQTGLAPAHAMHGPQVRTHRGPLVGGGLWPPRVDHPGGAHEEGPRPCGAAVGSGTGHVRGASCAGWRLRMGGS